MERARWRGDEVEAVSNKRIKVEIVERELGQT